MAIVALTASASLVRDLEKRYWLERLAREPARTNETIHTRVYPLCSLVPRNARLFEGWKADHPDYSSRWQSVRTRLDSYALPDPDIEVYADLKATLSRPLSELIHYGWDANYIVIRAPLRRHAFVTRLLVITDR